MIIKIYRNTIPRRAYPQNFMVSLQLSYLAIGIGLTLRHPFTHKLVFSITLVWGKRSIALGLNGYLG